MQYLRIGQVAKIAGVSRTSIWRWEEDGVLIPSYRTPGDHRRYEYRKVMEFLGIEEKEPCVFLSIVCRLN